MIHLTAHVEPFSAIIPELEPLLPYHYAELALDKESVPLDPDWARYKAMEDAGQLCTVVLRERGRLAGYCIMFVCPELHYKSTLAARMDVFWLRPDCRGIYGGVRMFRAMEAELKRRGVKRWFCGSKLHKDSGKLFEALGFRPIETWYSKMLEAP